MTTSEAARALVEKHLTIDEGPGWRIRMIRDRVVEEALIADIATALDAARREQLLEIAASFDDAAVMTDHWDYAAHCARWARRFRKQADALRQDAGAGEGR